MCLPVTLINLRLDKSSVSLARSQTKLACARRCNAAVHSFMTRSVSLSTREFPCWRRISNPHEMKVRDNQIMSCRRLADQSSIVCTMNTNSHPAQSLRGLVNPSRNVCTARPWSSLAIISYSLYLSHRPFFAHTMSLFCSLTPSNVFVLLSNFYEDNGFVAVTHCSP